MPRKSCLVSPWQQGCSRVLLYAQGNALGALVGGIATVWLAAIAAGKAKPWIGLLVSSLSALSVSLYLGVQHKGAAGKSICSVDQTFDCDKVNSSAYGELFDIPIASLGSSFYAGVAMLAILCLRSPAAYKHAAHLVAAGGAVSVLYSAFLGYVSIGIGAWCLFCISMYGLNAIILWQAWGLTRGSDKASCPARSAVVAPQTPSWGPPWVMLLGTMSWYNAGAGELPQGDSVTDLSALFEGIEGELTAGRYRALIRVGRGEIHRRRVCRLRVPVLRTPPPEVPPTPEG